MNSIWNKIKDGQSYFLLVLMSALTIFCFAIGDTTEGWVSLIITVGSFLLMQALKWTDRSGGKLPPPHPRTFEEGELKVLSGGMEPVPIPGEAEQHAQDCHICKRFKETL